MDYARSVLPIIKETRGMLMPHWGNVEIHSWKSEYAHDPVTQLDHDIEEFLADRLKKIDPSIGFRGEEFGGQTSERFWLCDPIDGTAHFIRGLPFCTVLLALIVRGEVVFGVVYDFVHDTVYHAQKGMGAFRDNEPIRVSDRSLKKAYLQFESHFERNGNFNVYQKLRERTQLVEFVCAGYELAMSAAGKLEGRVCLDPWGHDWDFAAGSLIVAEAGGVVANLGKRTYDYRNHDFLAVNPVVFAELTEGPDAIFPIVD